MRLQGETGIIADLAAGACRLQMAAGIDESSSSFFPIGIEMPCDSHLEVVGIRWEILFYCLEILLQTIDQFFCCLDLFREGLEQSILQCIMLTNMICFHKFQFCDIGV